MKRFSTTKDFLKMPMVCRGMKIGLFGGSFNPPHKGHILVAEMAIRRLKLDQVWWLVTPGNPLKSHHELAPLDRRILLSRDICKNPRVKITGFEAIHNFHHTAQTLDFIKKFNPGVRFVWLMGADNVTSFHHWQNWQYIVKTFPIAITHRSGTTISCLTSRMVKTFSYARIDETDAIRLIYLKAPAWTFLHGVRSPLSSTALRKIPKRQKTV